MPETLSRDLYKRVMACATALLDQIDDPNELRIHWVSEYKRIWRKDVAAFCTTIWIASGLSLQELGDEIGISKAGFWNAKEDGILEASTFERLLSKFGHLAVFPDRTERVHRATMATMERLPDFGEDDRSALTREVFEWVRQLPAERDFWRLVEEERADEVKKLLERVFPNIKGAVARDPSITQSELKELTIPSHKRLNAMILGWYPPFWVCGSILLDEGVDFHGVEES